MAQFIKSKRGKDLFVLEGYTFMKSSHDKAGTAIYWKCTEYHKNKCPGRCTTKNGKLESHKNKHNHLPDQSRIEARLVLQNVKELATSSQLSTQQIVAQSTMSIEPSVAAKLPSTSLMKRAIQKKRKIDTSAPPNPKKLTDLILPHEYQITVNGESFLIFDSGPADDRIIIFATNQFLNQLAQSDHWFADGTFKVVPKLFYQLFTIHGIRYNNVIPTVFALLPNKQTSTYIRMLEALKLLKPDLDPKSIMTDFEQATSNAFERSFPSASRRKCFFHFTQNLWRKIQDYSDIAHRYKTESEFAAQIKQLAALAFVPEEDVVGAFESLVADEFFTINETLLKNFLKYFELNYIGQFHLNRRREPLYDISDWNCYNSVKNGIAKTNNSVEGWHRKFSTLVGADHPSIWKFIDTLKAEQSMNEKEFNQYIAGMDPPTSRKTYRDIAKRINKIVEDYENREIMDYLRGIAYNFDLNV